MSKVDKYNCSLHNKGQSLTVLLFSCLFLQMKSESSYIALLGGHISYDNVNIPSCIATHPRDGLLIGYLMTCVGHYETKPLIYGNFTKKNICIHTNGMLENGFMHSY